LQVTHALDNSIYNFPLTLRRPLPANWPGAAVSQNGQPITAQFVNLNTTNYVMFDIVPNAGNAVLSKLTVPVFLSHPHVTNGASFNFLLNGQQGARYVISGSSDLQTWIPVQTSILSGSSLNLSMPISASSQCFRAQWMQ